jgi:hypothetical protein
LIAGFAFASSLELRWMFGILLFAIFLNVGSIVEPGAGADLVILRVAQRRLECCGFVSAADS